jgi:hypothetical protein
VQVYGAGTEGVERLDLIVGTLCEGNRPLHGFGQTLFAVFVQFASGRLQRDPWRSCGCRCGFETPHGARSAHRG